MAVAQYQKWVYFDSDVEVFCSYCKKSVVCYYSREFYIDVFPTGVNVYMCDECQETLVG
jgi:hypothetical protein